MSNKCVTWAWKQPLTSSIKLVLVNICDRANDQKGYQCWPAIETISKDTGLARRTVQRSLATLEKEKLIKIVRSSGGQRRPNRYKINIEQCHSDAVEQCQVDAVGEGKGVTQTYNGVTQDTIQCHSDTQTIRTYKKPNSPPTEMKSVTQDNDFDDLAKQFFNHVHGRKDVNTRFVTKLTNRFGKENMCYAFNQVIANKPHNPKSYLITVLKNMSAEISQKQTVIEVPFSNKECSREGSLKSAKSFVNDCMNILIQEK